MGGCLFWNEDQKKREDKRGMAVLHLSQIHHRPCDLSYLALLSPFLPARSLIVGQPLGSECNVFQSIPPLFFSFLNISF